MYVPFFALMLLLSALLLWATVEASRFLSQHPSIRDSDSLEAFKSLARRNMIGALAYLIGGAASMIASLFVIRAHGFEGLMVVLSTYAATFLLGTNLIRLERRARNLTCADEALTEAHRSIGISWRKKALPDF
jgi:hypothetical protein